MFRNRRKFQWILSALLVGIAGFYVYVHNPFKATSTFDQKAQELLRKHLEKYREAEYFSGASLSMMSPQKPIRSYYAGTLSHEADSSPIDNKTLFQIGSITKSFTAALILQLEKENRLTLQDRLDLHLPQYSKWGSITLNQLLNMTSGLPNYSDTSLFNVAVTQDPDKIWSADALIEFVYPENPFNPPLRQGYFYTNTGYVFADMIIEKLTQHSFREELEKRLIEPAKLMNTFYPVPKLEASQNQPLAHGYHFNPYDHPELVGKDVTSINLSWAGAAGGLVATTEDVIKWVHTLFLSETILDEHQKQKLMTLHSTQTGKPITMVSSTDPEGFGLGVVSKYQSDNDPEEFWFYEGQTFGFRAIYLYVPANKAIVAAAFNSSTDGGNDHGHELLLDAYRLIISDGSNKSGSVSQ